VFLPLRLGYERIWGNVRIPCCKWCCQGDNDDIIVIPWRNDLQLLDASSTSLSLPNNHGYNNIDGLDGQDDYSFDPSNAVDMQNNEFDNEVLSSSPPSNYQPNDTTNTPYLYSHQNHISMAMKVAPLWFTSNYFYAISLEYTTIASSTVLASMGSLFAFGFATCSSIGDERITKSKLVGVLLCFMGGVATAYTDISKNQAVGDDSENNDDTIIHRVMMRHWFESPQNNNAMTIPDNPSSFWGDMAGLLSAIGYGAYTNLLRHLCPQDEKRMSMQLFFGYVGLLNMVALLPVALWVLFSDSSSSHESVDGSAEDWINNTTQDGTAAAVATAHSTITWSIFFSLILKGLLDNVLSDYLWARAVILTSATVASVSVGLTIPMAFIADVIMGNENAHSEMQIVGAVLVLCGFVFVNVDGLRGTSGTRDGSNEDGEIEFESGGFDDDGRVPDTGIVL
jgi:solute carrier family 35 protein F5